LLPSVAFIAAKSHRISVRLMDLTLDSRSQEKNQTNCSVLTCRVCSCIALVGYSTVLK